MTDAEILEIYANAPVTKCELEVISLSASWFSKTYHLQYQDCEGVTVTLETGETVLAEYVPMKVGKSSSNEDLNDSRTVTVAMVNDIIASELDNYDPEVHEQPKITSRSYVMYRDLTVSNIKSTPVSLNVVNMTSDEEGTTFDISTKPVNNSYTGERITKERFETLKGVV